MEPRHDESKTPPESVPDATQSRFRIVKLEERIAPCNPHYNPKGKFVGVGNCHPYGGY